MPETTKCTAYPLNGCAHPQFCRDGCKARPIRVEVGAIPDMAQRQFINELGNRIILQVCKMPVSGDVQIIVAGPHSDSENLLTHDEAVMLRDALQEVLP